VNKLIPSVPDTLYHFTCVDHGHPGILGSGFIRPQASGISWFTDLEAPHPEALGMMRVMLNCNRMGVRYRIEDTTEIAPYLEFRLRMERESESEIARYLLALEQSPGALPRHWFVSANPVAAIYDPL
jgi:hypothetical protein